MTNKEIETIAKEITQELFSARIINANFFDQIDAIAIIKNKLVELYKEQLFEKEIKIKKLRYKKGKLKIAK